MTAPDRRVLVCGGRDWGPKSWNHFSRFLDEIGPTLIIEGGAPGADRASRRYAEQVGIACATFRAWWGVFGKGAGPRRNGWMLQYGQPDVVVACPGGRGTENMVSSAQAAGIEVVRYGDEP